MCVCVYIYRQYVAESLENFPNSIIDQHELSYYLDVCHDTRRLLNHQLEELRIPTQKKLLSAIPIVKFSSLSSTSSPRLLNCANHRGDTVDHSVSFFDSITPNNEVSAVALLVDDTIISDYSAEPARSTALHVPDTIPTAFCSTISDKTSSNTTCFMIPDTLNSSPVSPGKLNISNEVFG